MPLNNPQLPESPLSSRINRRLSVGLRIVHVIFHRLGMMFINAWPTLERSTTQLRQRWLVYLRGTCQRRLKLSRSLFQTGLKVVDDGCAIMLGLYNPTTLSFPSDMLAIIFLQSFVSA